MTNFSILIDRLVAKTLSSLIFVSNATKKITKKNTYLLENENDLHPLTIKNGIPNNPIVFANNDVQIDKGCFDILEQEMQKNKNQIEL